jgi:two-component system chemotaxis response regulator CheB
VAPGFVNDLAQALDMTSILRVKVAEHGEPLLPQTVYIAPDDHHLGLAERARIALSDAAPIDGCRPSATFLFESLAREFGAAASAVVLTGKGPDGVRGLAAIRKAGGRIIAQDEQTSVAFETAAAAREAGLVDLTLPVMAIPGALTSMLGGVLPGRS